MQKVGVLIQLNLYGLLIYMKLIVPCMECGNLFLQEQTDEGIYVFKCPKNHENRIVLQNLKFEILFKIGGLAYLDCYYRECVSSITSSFERFMEFYIRVILIKNKLDIELINNTWKQVTRMSERQSGAYKFLYLINERNIPPDLNKIKLTGKKKYSLVEFRNNVIHRGMIPTRDEAYNYADKIFKLISITLSNLKKNDKEYIDKFYFVHQSELKRKFSKNSVATQVIPTMISATVDYETEISDFNEGVEKLKSVRDRAFVN